MTTLMVACGGTVRKGDTDGETPDEGDDPGATPGGGGEASGPQVDLPECKLGVEQSRAERCIFLYEGRCYDDKIPACACACKRRSGTVCVSGFEDDHVPTTVSCH